MTSTARVPNGFGFIDEVEWHAIHDPRDAALDLARKRDSETFYVRQIKAMWTLRRRIQQSHGMRPGGGEKSRRQFFILTSTIAFLRAVRAEIAALQD